MAFSCSYNVTQCCSGSVIGYNAALAVFRDDVISTLNPVLHPPCLTSSAQDPTPGDRDRNESPNEG